MNKSYIQHQKDLKRWGDKYKDIKPVNQLIVGVPKELKGAKFETVDYLLGRSTPKCPYKFEELPYLQYFGRSKEYHLFLSCGEFNRVIICKMVEK